MPHNDTKQAARAPSPKSDKKDKGVIDKKRLSYTHKVIKGIQRLIIPIVPTPKPFGDNDYSAQSTVVVSHLNLSVTDNPDQQERLIRKVVTPSDNTHTEDNSEVAIATTNPLISDDSKEETVASIIESEQVEKCGSIDRDHVGELENNERISELFVASDSDLNLPVLEFHPSTTTPFVCSWLPLYDIFAPLFCLPPSSPADLEDEGEYVVHPNHVENTRNSPQPTTSLSAPPTSSHRHPTIKEIDTEPQGEIVQGLSKRFIKYFCHDLLKRAKEYLDLSHSPSVQFKWVLQSIKNDVTIHSCNIPSDSAIVIRSQYTIDSSLNIVRDALMAEDTMKVLDAALENFETILDYQHPRAVVRKYMYKAYFPISPRDFVALTACETLPHGELIASSSLSDELFPPVNGFVRAHLIMSAFYLVPQSSTRTTVTMINHSDLAANVPAYLMNKAAVNIPVQYAKSLKKLCSERNSLALL